jgi:ribosome-binding ATPase YchF (GTP1/OBG family)
MSKLSVGIVGLPNVGKSTLFKTLTNMKVNIANYPFCTIDPTIGVVPVPDETLNALAAMSGSAQTIPAVVEFYDIAGLVKGASRGEGLGNQFLSHIRETNAIVMVLRCFADQNIMHVEQSVDPVRDLEIIETELALKDLEAVNRRLEKTQGEARSGKKEAYAAAAALARAAERLSAGGLLADMASDPVIADMGLLTAKPRVYVANGDAADIPPALTSRVAECGGEIVAVNLASSDAARGVSDLIRACYAVLGLTSFYTTGEAESRAWTIRRGSRAPQAAGAIHSDFEKKFIRAEVIAAEKLLASGSWVKAKAAGLVRLEGKEYVVQDRDVMVIRHG